MTRRPACWVVCADGPRAARWERVWAALGAVPRRVSRLAEAAAGPGLALADLEGLRPDPAAVLAAARAKAPRLAVVACAGRGAAPVLAPAALAAGALDLFQESDEDAALAARLASHLKRLFPRAPAPGAAGTGAVRMDLRAREVRVRRGRAWRSVAGLTAREFDLLAALAAADGRPLTREALLDALGAGSGPEAVDRAAGAARRKLGPAGRLLVSVRGVGYRLDNGRPRG